MKSVKIIFLLCIDLAHLFGVHVNICLCTLVPVFVTPYCFSTGFKLGLVSYQVVSIHLCMHLCYELLFPLVFVYLGIYVCDPLSVKMRL